MAKQITVSIPDNVALKSAKEVGLGGAKSLAVPQAKGGNYRVAVGGSLKASETSMGRLASSLKGVNQALNMYSDIQVKREERGLDEIRRMSNDKKRELIGAENAVFRKMGIRPQSILQVKHSLGTAESGKFQGEWQQHLDNVLIPSQASGGNPLTAKAIQKEYVKFRQGWANSNEFLSQSQLSTDGFLADTDGLFDRNSAYYFKSADGYYEQNVQRFSAGEAIWATVDTNPENLLQVIKDNAASMDVKTFRSVIGDMTTKAIQSGDEAMLEKMQTIVGTMANSDFKLGSQKFSDTMAFELMSPKIAKAKDDASYNALVRDSNEQKLEDAKMQREVQTRIAQYKVDSENANSDYEKKVLRSEAWGDIQENFDVVGEGYGLDLLNQLEGAKITLNSQRRSEQAVTDKENTEVILSPVQDAIFGYKPTSEINSVVEQQKTALDAMVESGSISERAAQEAKGQLHAFGNATNQNTMRLDKAISLAERTKVDPEFRAAQREQEYYSIMNSAKFEMKDASGNPISKHSRAANLEVLKAGDMSAYSFNPSNFNMATRKVFTDFESDVQDRREALSKQAYERFAPASGGEITIEMEEYVTKGLDAYITSRRASATQDLVDIHEQREQLARNAEMRSKGYNVPDGVSEFERNERYEGMKAWEASVEDGNDDMFNFTRDAVSGEVSVSIGSDWARDLDDSQPFTGMLKNKHIQFQERYELLNQRDAIQSGPDNKGLSVFDALDDETKSRLSSRYAESLQLESPLYKEKRIDTLLRNVDRGQLIFSMGTPAYGIGMVNPLPEGEETERFDEQTYEGRREAIKKVITAYSLSSVPTEHWRDENYGGNPNFTLRGPEGNVAGGLGYQNRKEIAFVPQEIIQKLHSFVGSDQATGNIRNDLRTGLARLPKDDVGVVRDALKYFYITAEREPASALLELFNNHRAIYSVNQGHNFDQ